MVALIELDELGLADTILEQEVVCVTVGFGHDAEVHINQAHASATSEHDLYIGTIKDSFKEHGYGNFGSGTEDGDEGGIFLCHSVFW